MLLLAAAAVELLHFDLRTHYVSSVVQRNRLQCTLSHSIQYMDSLRIDDGIREVCAKEVEKSV